MAAKNRPSLREQHVEQTRQRLLDAVIDILVEDGNDELSPRKIARRAGVSAPTAYRHFATRLELIDAAMAWADTRMKRPSDVRDIDELIAALPAIHQAYFTNARLMTAYVRSGSDLRAAGRQRRARGVEAVLRRSLPQLSDDERRAFAALIQLFVSSATWDLWRSVWQLEGERAGRVAAWAVAALVDAQRRDRAGFARAVAPTSAPRDPQARGRKR
jgi:AcrR family transcriptional regulator